MWLCVSYLLPHRRWAHVLFQTIKLCSQQQLLGFASFGQLLTRFTSVPLHADTLSPHPFPADAAGRGLPAGCWVMR